MPLQEARAPGGRGSGTGVDAAGLGTLKSTVKFFKYFKNKETLTQTEADNLLSDAVKDLVVAIGGIGASLILASFFDDDDFVGAYDPARFKYDELVGSTKGIVVRIGNKWVSLDYNIFAIPLVGILYAKKYGQDNVVDKLFSYAKGVGTQFVSNLPVISTFYETIKGADDRLPDDADFIETMRYFGKNFMKEVIGRVPGILQDIALIADDTKRDTTKLSDAFLAKLPFLSKLTPEKKNIFGETIKTEVGQAEGLYKVIAAFYQLFAGARIKEVIGDEVDK